MIPIPFLWISIAIIFLLAEVGHPGLFFFLPFACGASLSALIGIWTDSLVIQLLCFLVSSLIAFSVIHVWLKKSVPSTPRHQKTNIDALVGLHADVTQTIEKKGTGYVKLNGQAWLARSIDGERIEINSTVDIVAVSGAHLIVRKVHNQQ